jgi:hypothetical protein
MVDKSVRDRCITSSLHTWDLQGFCRWVNGPLNCTKLMGFDQESNGRSMLTSS